MFKRGSVVMTIWDLIVAAALIAFGIATCVNRANADFRNVIILIVGIFVIVDAGLRVLTQVIQFVRTQSGMLIKTDLASAVTAASELAVGILLIMISQNVADMSIVLKYLILFVSILLITLGGVGLIYTIVFLIKKVGSMAQNIFGLIFGALLITGGVLILIYAKEETVLEFIFIVLGIFFLLGGIGVAILAVSFLVLRQREKKALGDEPAAVDAEEASVEEPAAEEDKEEPKGEPSESEK